jgi:diguanylate cyclase (GGDEF)-like protein/PAS domain S-box-containing protein
MGDYTPASQALMRAALPRATAGAEENLELELARPDGERLWIRLRSTTVFEEGRPVRILGAIQDITSKVAQRHALERAQQRVKLALDSGGIAIWDVDLVHDTMFWDDQMCAFYGIARPPEHDSFARWTSMLHPEDREATVKAVQDAIAGLRPYAAEFRIIRPDGTVRHLAAVSEVIRAADGTPLRIVGTNRDITEAKRLAEEFASQHELLRVTLESIGDAVITTDAKGRVVWLNPVAERLTGWPVADAVGRMSGEIFKLVNESTRAPAEDPIAECLTQGRIVSPADEALLIGRDGAECGIEDSCAPIRNVAGEILGTVLVFHDVTEQRRLAREMNYRATHDTLTGLYNRAEFEVRLRAMLHKSHGENSESTLLFIDLDQFKIVNDTSGHGAGDELLQLVARLLQDAVRLSDTVARLGGDEFAIILDRCNAEQGGLVAQKICDRMEEFRFAHGEHRFRVGASIGLVPVDERWTAISAIIQAADSSCYAAKEAGRNRVHVWYDTDRAMRARHGETQWATRLAQALDEDGFVLFAQRIQQLRGPNRGIHAEILIRMVEANGGLAPPGAFLPAAERFHLASRIDRWVLRKAIAWMNAADSLDSIATICVNLSGQSVGDRAFHRWAIAMLGEAGDGICRRLCLEITETAAITNLADAALFIEKVRAIGVRVALDDFGAGASSFGYLKTIPVDFLKIDGQFIRDLATDTLDEAAVRCFADVAAVVGMKTVAEFVDSQAVLDKLRRMGIDYAQGYLIHKPAPIAELLGLPIPQPAGAAD